jgi:hypothetical protein
MTESIGGLVPLENLLNGITALNWTYSPDALPPTTSPTRATEGDLTKTTDEDLTKKTEWRSPA